MNKKPYYKANNWNTVEEQVDRSAWARLNDIVYEPRRVPIYKDQKEFLHLPKNEQTVILHSFGSLTLSSTLQMKVALSEIKKDAENSEEVAVYNALQYLESINNKAYSYVLAEFSDSKKQEDAYEWANQNPYLQTSKYSISIRKYYSEKSCSRFSINWPLSFIIFWPVIFIRTT